MNPSATELCNGVDDNCDGTVDEGLRSTFYADTDGDRYGDASAATSACSTPAGYVVDATDCDDTSASVYPGAPEVCDDGIDQDCDGVDTVCPDTGDTADAADTADTADSSDTADTAGPGDVDDTGTAPKGCGCATPGPGGVSLGVALAALALRRRRGTR